MGNSEPFHRDGGVEADREHYVEMNDMNTGAVLAVKDRFACVRR